MTSNPWHPDGKGIQLGGDVGGDDQAGDAYEVRFARDDMPGSLITVNVYAVKSRLDERWGYQIQTEYLVCTDPADPGGTEVWSDYDYEDSALDYEDRTLADHDARETAERILATGEQAEGWDGKPEWERS